MIEVTLNGEAIALDTEGDFLLDDNALNYEASRMGKLLMSYGNLAMDMKAQAMRARQTAERTYALESFRLRTQYAQAKQKYTEGMIKDQVIQIQSYISSMEAQTKAEAEAMKVDYFYKSLLKKNDLLISLVYKEGREISRIGTVME